MHLPLSRQGKNHLVKSKRKTKYISTTFPVNMKIPTCIDDKHTITHNKAMVIDKITGSFNFPKSAEELNAENLLIVKSKWIVKIYARN
ncbi:phospholipase D-like domain-containing protein [Syntrophorhabdus aromaticivorans]|nr:phospholipase D-like domain-containing protein [Syntrophorhabdus aromaticivorans]